MKNNEKDFLRISDNKKEKLKKVQYDTSNKINYILSTRMGNKEL